MPDKDFNFSESDSNNKLSVLLMADSFFYTVHNLIGELVLHKSFQSLHYNNDRSTNKLKLDESLKKNFVSVNICFISKHTFLTQSEDVDMLKLLPAMEFKNKYVEKISGDGVFNFFGLSQYQEILLNQLFGENKFRVNTPLALLGEWFASESKDIIHLHMEETFMLIYIQKAGRPVFYNTFHIEHVNDVLYFSLAAARKTEINPESIRLSMSGWVEKDSKLYTTLSAYYGQISLIDAGFRLSANVVDGVKSHHYFMHFLNAL